MISELRYNNCPFCGYDGDPYKIEAGKRMKCPNCSRKFSLTSGTIFDNSKLTVGEVNYAIRLYNDNNNISSVDLSKKLRITQKSSWHLREKLKKMSKAENVVSLTNYREIDVLNQLKKMIDKKENELKKMREAYSSLNVIWGMNK